MNSPESLTSEQERATCRSLFGTETAPAARIPLRAGPLALVLEGGDLRQISAGPHELVRRIYGAVRDRVWGTVPGVISQLRLHRVTTHSPSAMCPHTGIKKSISSGPRRSRGALTAGSSSLSQAWLSPISPPIGSGCVPSTRFANAPAFRLARAMPKAGMAMSGSLRSSPRSSRSPDLPD